jgi:hypothetical protein
MRSLIYRRKLLAALACLVALMSLPLAIKPGIAEASTLLLQDHFDDGPSAAWTVESGQWSVEEGAAPVLFSDDFENGNAAKWSLNGGSWSPVTDGAATAYRQSAGGASELAAGDAAWTDYAYEADIKLLNGAGAMMDFRYQDSQHFYYLYMSESYIRIMKQNGDVQSWISAYEGPSLQTSAYVRIKVEAIGDTFRVYRNDELVLTASDDDSPYLSGRIALATWDTSVEVDNVRVTGTGINHVYAQTEMTGGTVYAGEASWSHYELKARIALEEAGQDGSVGILLRRQISGDGYWMRYSSGDGAAQIVKRSGDSDIVLAETPFFMEPGRSYDWHGVAAGDKLTLHIDGAKLLETSDSAFAAGGVALMTLQATAGYDNVTASRVTVPVDSDGNTVYYVSSSLGDDDNDGLTEGSAWRTLNKINNGTFRAGDRILLKAGDGWNEPLVLRGSGEPGNPIAIGAYGDGDKPVVNWNAPNGGSVVTGYNLSHWVIEGLSVHIIASSGQSWDRITVGIQLHYDNSALHRDVRIENNDVYSDTYDSNTNGIMISAMVPGTDGKEVARDLTIANNTVHDVAWYGITTTGWDVERNEELRSQLLYGNVNVVGNHVYRTASQGIVVQNAHDSAIERNVVHDGGLGTDTWGPGGLWFIASRDSVIRFNEVYNMKDASSGYDGAGINVDWYCDNITVQYNYSHGNKGNGMTTMSNNGAKIIQNRVEGNQAQQSNGRGQIALGNFTGRPDLSTGLHNVVVAGNMIIVDVDGTGAVNTASNPHGTWTGNEIRDNNIVIRPNLASADVFSIGPNTIVSAIDGNRIYGPQASFRSILNGNAYDTLAAWQEATGYDLSSSVRPLDETAPAATGNLVAAFDRYVQLSWTAPEEQSSGISHYNIYRGTQPDFEPAYANMVGESYISSFEDRENLQPNTTYYYKVNAEGNNGYFGEASAVTSVTTGDVIPPVVKPSRVGFLAPRDGDYITTASMATRPYLSGIDDIRKVELYVDGRLKRELQASPFAATLDGLGNGEHALQYRVYDASGFVHESETITIEKQTRALRSLYAETSPLIDGDLSEWDAAAPGFTMDKQDQVREIEAGFVNRWSADVLTAKGSTRWDENKLYLAVEVRENKHHLPISSASDLWKGSSIQIAVDPQRGSKPGAKGYTELAFGLTDGGSALAYRYHAVAGKTSGPFTAGELAVVRDETAGVTRYEIAIPWQELLPEGVMAAAGSELGISILANYSDGTVVNPDSSDARNGWIEYNSGIGAGKSPELFGYLLPMRTAFAAPVATGSSAADGTLSIQWTASDGATGYAVRYGTSSGTYTTTVDAGGSTSLRLAGLSLPQTYYVSVLAYNGYGESIASNELRLAAAVSGGSGTDSGIGGGNAGDNDGDGTGHGADGKNVVSVALAELDADNPLKLKLERASLSIQPSLLRELLRLAGSTDGARLEVSVVPLENQPNIFVPAAQDRARLKAAGPLLRIDIVAVKADGERVKAKPARGDAILSLPFDENLSVDEDFLGLYAYDPDSGKWLYAGGNVDAADGSITAAISDNGVYAVLEYRKTFHDVQAAHWAIKAVTTLAAKHIVFGINDTDFKPGGQTTRAEFTALLVRALQLPVVRSTAFADVAQDAWYAEAVGAAVEAGIVAGRGEQRFAPNEPISRAEMAAMIVRAIGLPTGGTADAEVAGYADANDIPSWARPYVTAASEASLMQGRSGGIFAPLANATRAEAAQLVYNLLRVFNP